jgi:hypothetical protein
MKYTRKKLGCGGCIALSKAVAALGEEIAALKKEAKARIASELTRIIRRRIDEQLRQQVV